MASNPARPDFLLAASLVWGDYMCDLWRLKVATAAFLGVDSAIGWHQAPKLAGMVLRAARLLVLMFISQLRVFDPKTSA